MSKEKSLVWTFVEYDDSKWWSWEGEYQLVELLGERYDFEGRRKVYLVKVLNSDKKFATGEIYE